ncbi:putative bifunctional diguanylate cyclase/phosphodiesterase [Vibrio japonicus]|uniref:Bifunctional diguanylate cyclase/phosphodiesterase n=1 Tax=Vibrio japonicus TaxID=1824638 RepID=A0ABY5LLH6_9VIBR|nr:bifunctional diguanylate cyclase/phosphodiesterase [Vibrio japonicus]UUM31688.1 bifunctional diguanylate cyclase/phosphodiesterase [Vibrio japonicus]
MENSIKSVHHRNAFLIALRCAFLFSVASISYTLINEHQHLNELYILFPISILMAYFARRHQTKVVCSLFSLFVVFAGSIADPLSIDTVEESFILLPLCYIFIFPGSLWPIAVGLALVCSYLIDYSSIAHDEFLEDAIEVIFITTFATVMTYFQQKSIKQVQLYKKASLTDYLTKLSNRQSFFQQIRDLEANQHTDYALIQIGLKRLKAANDNLGHGYGDELLRKFAILIRKAVGEHGRVFRLGGNELAILVEFDVGDNYKVEQIIAALESRNDTVCNIYNTCYTLRYNGGVATLSQAENNKRVWCKNVDAAESKAKLNDEGKIQWYDDGLMEETIRHQKIESELKAAIPNNQLFLVYQPKIDVESNQIIGAEVLLRWEHPELGLVSPLEFISVAEKTAQIIPIGRWVIEQAIKQAKVWQGQGHDLCVAVNVSTVQFTHDDIYQCISENLAKHDLAAKYLQVEITETSMMDKRSKVAETCKQLQQLGVSVAIDDFGIEYSSLNYLKHLPIDTIKIDKSFIDDCVTDEIDHMIVRTIIQIGHNLNKQVVAEGVETDQQLELLRREECTQFQGYLYSKPVLPEQFTRLLESNSQATIEPEGIPHRFGISAG